MAKIKTFIEKYDAETGEAIKSYSFIEDDKAELEEWKKIHLSPFPYKPNSRYTKAYHTGRPEYSNSSFLGYFYILSTHLQPSLNCIAFRRYKGEKVGWVPANRVDLQNILKVSKATVSRFLDESINKQIIAEGKIRVGSKKETRLIVNPAYAFNGGRLDNMLYDIFKECEEFQKTLSDEEKKWYETGINFGFESDEEGYYTFNTKEAPENKV
jgi:hypothetical protein